MCSASQSIHLKLEHTWLPKIQVSKDTQGEEKVWGGLSMSWCHTTASSGSARTRMADSCFRPIGFLQNLDAPKKKLWLFIKQNDFIFFNDCSLNWFAFQCLGITDSYRKSAVKMRTWSRSDCPLLKVTEMWVEAHITTEKKLMGWVVLFYFTLNFVFI